METNNFDNKIKNQLEQRTIEPSAKSWEQLRSKLDKKDKKLVPIFWWTTIAATFVGGVLLISFLFNSSTFVQNDSITKENIEAPPSTAHTNHKKDSKNQSKYRTRSKQKARRRQQC
jgi:cytoskeletal protein RodZ